MIAELSDENPRDDLWMLTKAVYDNIQKAKLTTKDLMNTVNKTINEYIGLTTDLTENQREAI